MKIGPGEWEAPDAPQHKLCKASHQILLRGALAAMHLEGLYEGSKLVGKDRKLEEVRQDLLRAMLLFCTATLDAVLQRLLQDSLPDLIRANPDARCFRPFL